MIRSMTGFGTAEGDVGGSHLVVEVRSVNHRFFNPSLKLPSSLARWETDAREALRRQVARGHVTLSARYGPTAGEPEVRIDERRLVAYATALRDVAARLNLDAGSIDLATLLRLPQVVVTDDAAPPLQDGTPFVRLVERAAEAMDDMRRAEGGRLVTFIEERLRVIEESMARIAARAPARLVEQRDRLRTAVQELAEGIRVDDQRLAQEIAILADRLDVSEEIQRFGAHLVAFRAALAAPPREGVGKRLGFLLQELLRETNTTGSKGSDAAMLGDVLVIKEELERIREQVENLE